MDQETNLPNSGDHWIICRYITKSGKRIYPKSGKYFRFRAKNPKNETGQ